MRPRLGLLTVLVVGLASGCEDELRDPSDLDAIVEPECAGVEIIHEKLELGGELHHFVSDGPRALGGWGLITADTDNGEQLALVRVAASEDEGATEPVLLGLPSGAAGELRLHIGAAPGELWVLSQPSTAVVLRRLLPELGEVGRNSTLSNFPAHDGGAGCPTTFTRELLLSEGRPHLLALPDCSEDPALVLHLLALERDTLLYETSWELAFDPCADFDEPAACAEVYAYTLAGVGPGSSSAFPGPARVQFGFTQVRAYAGNLGLGGTVLSSDVSLLDMRLSAGGPQARMVTFREVWVHSFPIALGRVALALDPYSTLLHVRNQLVDDDAALLRFDTIGDSFVLLRDPELLPFAGRGQLVQLGNQGALIHVDAEAGALRGAPLIDIDSWPQWNERTLLELEGLVAAEPSGVGNLLLRREEQAPQLVHLACIE